MARRASVFRSTGSGDAANLDTLGRRNTFVSKRERAGIIRQLKKKVGGGRVVY